MINNVNEQENDQDKFVVDDLFLINHIWHFKVDDKLGWDFCADLLKAYIQISPQELEKRFKHYFNETMGIEPYTPCPCCNNDLLPRESQYGYFVGCSAYPNCRFIATSKKPYRKIRSIKK